MSSSSCCLESAPCWHRLSYSIKTLFDTKLDNIDFNQLGSAGQRMKYEDFERIFYHLMLIIDPVDTKRKFKGHYPARTKEEQSVFVDTLTKAINDRQPQLHSRRVASSQLRMFGGGPFRSLVSSLVRAASEREIEKLKAKLDLKSRDFESNLGLSLSLESLFTNHTNQLTLNCYKQPLAGINLQVKNLGDNLQSSLEHLLKCEQSVREALEQAQELWCLLAPRSERKIVKICDYSQEHMNSICRADLSRLELTHSQIEKAMEKVNAIYIPQQQQPSDGQQTIDGNRQAPVVKRLSQFIREKKSQFDPERELLREAISQGAIQPEKMLQQLVEHDNQMVELIEMWRTELELAEEQLLGRPEILEKFRAFELVIPQISLERITSEPGREFCRVAPEEIDKILKQYGAK